jgi:dihydroorotate dehydrogenase electron transfer subunit
LRQVKLVRAPILSNEVVLREREREVCLLWAQAPEIGSLSRPGQYCMARCGEGHEMPLRRPLSVHRVSQDTVAFLFAVVGRGTEWLAQRREGDSLELLGPLGNGFEVHPSSRNLLLVAGGIGIAPLAALAEQAAAIGRSVTLLMGDRTAVRICPRSLLPSGVKTVVATEDGSLGTKGMVTDLVPQFVPGADQVFACGPLPMYRRMAGMGAQLGDKPAQVLLEAVLGCGVGACLGCTVETTRGQRSVCKDGPVFELDEVMWDKVVAPPAGRRY